MINDQQIGLTGVNGIFLYFTEELTMKIENPQRPKLSVIHHD